MSNAKQPQPNAGFSNASFLPEDYLQRKADRRTNTITFTLFCVVMFGVAAAFFVTNRQWSSVKEKQEQINRLYAEESKKIEQLKELERQRAEMLEKAEITTALKERVPRSIFLAELINRMPAEMTLTELNLDGRRITPTVPKPDPKRAATNRGQAARTPGSGNVEEQAPAKPLPPSYEFRVEIVGLSATDEEVADYQAALHECELLDDVDLMYTGETIIDEVSMRKFRIEASIRPDADAREIDPLRIPRLHSIPYAGSKDAEDDNAASGLLKKLLTGTRTDKENDQ